MSDIQFGVDDFKTIMLLSESTLKTIFKKFQYLRRVLFQIVQSISLNGSAKRTSTFYHFQRYSICKKTFKEYKMLEENQIYIKERE